MYNKAIKATSLFLCMHLNGASSTEISSYAIDTMRFALAQQLELVEDSARQSPLVPFFRQYTQQDSFAQLVQDPFIQQRARACYRELQLHPFVQCAQAELYKPGRDVAELPQRLYTYIAVCSNALADQLDQRTDRLDIHTPLHMMINAHKHAELDAATCYLLKTGLVTLGLCITQGKTILTT